jgi:hypothetical protein
MATVKSCEGFLLRKIERFGPKADLQVETFTNDCILFGPINIYRRTIPNNGEICDEKSTCSFFEGSAPAVPLTT